MSCICHGGGPSVKTSYPFIRKVCSVVACDTYALDIAAAFHHFWAAVVRLHFTSLSEAVPVRCPMMHHAYARLRVLVRHQSINQSMLCACM